MSIKIVYSRSHTIFPKIILGILIFFAVIMFIQALMKAKKLNCPVFNIKSKKFFIDNHDKVKFYGTLILLVLYVFGMNILGFIAGSIIFISLFNILYAGKKDIKTIVICIGIATVETLLVWFIFGYVFDITLP